MWVHLLLSWLKYDDDDDVPPPAEKMIQKKFALFVVIACIKDDVGARPAP